jgi:hypothetical protein
LLESAGLVVVSELGLAEAAGAASGGGSGTDGFGLSGIRAEATGRKSLIGMTPWYELTE